MGINTVFFAMARMLKQPEVNPHATFIMLFQRSVMDTLTNRERNPPQFCFAHK